MKSLIISFIILCNFTSLLAQDICTNDSIKYLRAYEYIVNDSLNYNKTINVSNIIVDLDRKWFLTELDSLPKEKETIKSLTKYSWFTSFYSPNLVKLFSKNNNPPPSKTILFFSTIEKNTLCVDLFDNKGNLDEYDYNWIASQNNSHMYLFFFDSYGNITSSFRKEICYSF